MLLYFARPATSPLVGFNSIIKRGECLSEASNQGGNPKWECSAPSNDFRKWLIVLIIAFTEDNHDNYGGNDAQDTKLL